MIDGTEPVEVIETPETEALEPVVEAEPVEEGALVVQIGDEAPEDDTDEDGNPLPKWGKELRRISRQKDAEIKELKRALAVKENPALPSLGEKPRIDDPDIDYDADLFEQRILEYNDRKRKIDEDRLNAEKQQEQAQQSWQAKVSSYNEAKVKAPYADFDEAEAFVTDMFDVTQQGLLIKVAKDAPTLVYALGKNPKKAAELAAIKDYAEFVAEAVRVEMNVKTSRKPATSPERTVSVPTVPGVSSTDNTLERLREDAAKTGDFSKVMAYKRSMRA
jgi:hypothetical protein